MTQLRMSQKSYLERFVGRPAVDERNIVDGKKCQGQSKGCGMLGGGLAGIVNTAKISGGNGSNARQSGNKEERHGAIWVKRYTEVTRSYVLEVWQTKHKEMNL